MRLADFKERGIVRYDKVLSIATTERIPAMVATRDGRFQVLTALTAAIKSAMSNINVRVGLNEEQMVDLADKVIDEAHEDNLAIEDVLLFLGKFITGEYGKINDRMDMTIFFERFEMYRQTRYEELLKVRDEQNINFKSAGRDTNYKRMERDANIDPSTFFDLMQTYNEGKDDSGS